MYIEGNSGRRGSRHSAAALVRYRALLAAGPLQQRLGGGHARLDEAGGQQGCQPGQTHDLLASDTGTAGRSSSWRSCAFARCRRTSFSSSGVGSAGFSVVAIALPDGAKAAD